jgi:hypothetical protein
MILVITKGMEFYDPMPFALPKKINYSGNFSYMSYVEYAITLQSVLLACGNNLQRSYHRHY